MTDEELAAVATWLRHYQGIELDQARLREPAAVAGKLSTLAERAANGLPFGAEPSGFDFTTGTFKRANGKRSGGRRAGGGDAG